MLFKKTCMLMATTVAFSAVALAAPRGEIVRAEKKADDVIRERSEGKINERRAEEMNREKVETGRSIIDPTASSRKTTDVLSTSPALQKEAADIQASRANAINSLGVKKVSKAAELTRDEQAKLATATTIAKQLGSVEAGKALVSVSAKDYMDNSLIATALSQRAARGELDKGLAAKAIIANAKLTKLLGGSPLEGVAAAEGCTGMDPVAVENLEKAIVKAEAEGKDALTAGDAMVKSFNETIPGRKEKDSQEALCLLGKTLTKSMQAAGVKQAGECKIVNKKIMQLEERCSKI